MFSHEKLDVYQTYLTFATCSAPIVERAEKWHAFCDHLERATESVGANIARANTQDSALLVRNYAEIAIGSDHECAACLDVANAKDVLPEDEHRAGRVLLWRIRGMLLGLRKAGHRVHEDTAPYGDPQFPHDRLDVYKLGLALVTWVHGLQVEFDLPTRQRNRIDHTTTGILLNIAEGSGKSSTADKQKFLNTSYFHTLQTAIVLDLLVARGCLGPDDVAEGKQLADRIAGMLQSWIRGFAENSKA